MGAMTVTNGLYSIQIEMTDGGHGRANGVIVLLDGKIAGGDSYFYYTGSYVGDRGKWRGELITNEHAQIRRRAAAVWRARSHLRLYRLLFRRTPRDVNGTALVGKTSVVFRVARLAAALSEDVNARVSRARPSSRSCSECPWSR